MNPDEKQRFESLVSELNHWLLKLPQIEAKTNEIPNLEKSLEKMGENYSLLMSNDITDLWKFYRELRDNKANKTELHTHESSQLEVKARPVGFAKPSQESSLKRVAKALIEYLP